MKKTGDSAPGAWRLVVSPRNQLQNSSRQRGGAPAFLVFPRGSARLRRQETQGARPRRADFFRSFATDSTHCAILFAVFFLAGFFRFFAGAPFLDAILDAEGLVKGAGQVHKVFTRFQTDQHLFLDDKFLVRKRGGLDA